MKEKSDLYIDCNGEIYHFSVRDHIISNRMVDMLYDVLSEEDKIKTDAVQFFCINYVNNHNSSIKKGISNAPIIDYNNFLSEFFKLYIKKLEKEKKGKT